MASVLDPHCDPQHLLEAVEASEYEFAFHSQLQEVITFSNFAFAIELQLHEALSASQDGTFASAVVAGSSNDASGSLGFFSDASTSASMAIDQAAAYDSCDGRFPAEDAMVGGHEGQQREGKQPIYSSCPSTVITVSNRVTNATPALTIELCPVCLEKKDPDEMFQVMHCLHRLCIPCMVQHVHYNLQDKRLPIRCAQAHCDELLTPEDCENFLPKECYDAWRTTIVEAEIPESERVYCPFSDCSALLVKDKEYFTPMPFDQEYFTPVPDSSEESVVSSAECPFCNRLFCVQCLVPWHSGLQCSEYQALPQDERKEEDLTLFCLAHEKKWQRCKNCKRIVELSTGCNHITCRCGHEFCYLCGNNWETVHKCITSR